MKKFFLVFMIVVITMESFTANALENMQTNAPTHTYAPKNNGKNNLFTIVSKLLGPAAVIIFIAGYAYELFKGQKEPKPDPVEQRKHQEELEYQQALRSRLQEQCANLLAISSQYQHEPTNYDFVPQNVMQARLTNLAEHAKQNTHQISTKTFLLSQSAQKIIVENCLPLHAYQTMTGSPLQHTLHTECLQVIDTIAGTAGSSQTNQVLMSFVELSREHNHAGMVRNALHILDVCWSFIRSSTLAIGYGVFEGIQDTLQTIKHVITDPRGAVVDLATQVKNTAYGIAHCIKKYPALCSAVLLHGSEPLIDAVELVHAGNSFRLYYSMHPPTTVENHANNNQQHSEFAQSIKNTAQCLVRFIKQHESLYSLLQQDYQREQLMLTQELGRITNALGAYCINKPYDALKDSSRMATQCFLMHKSTHCLNKFFASAYQKVPAYIEKIKQGSRAVMMEEIPVAVALQTTEAIAPAALQEELFVLEKVVQEEKAVGSVVTIPLVEDLVTNLTALLEPVRQELPQLKQMFDNARKGFGEFATKYIKIPYNHILGIDWFAPVKDILKWSGFHHDLWGVIEKSGLVQFVDKVVHSNGFYTAKVIINGISDKKTFFPQHWSREKVISKILEAYDHFIKTGAKNYELKSNGKYIVTGLIDEGIEIKIHITKNGQIKSAYPVLK